MTLIGWATLKKIQKSLFELKMCKILKFAIMSGLKMGLETGLVILDYVMSFLAIFDLRHSFKV